MTMRKPGGGGSTDVFVAFMEDKSAESIYGILSLVNSRFKKFTGVCEFAWAPSLHAGSSMR
jgi:hypothetical protein